MWLLPSPEGQGHSQGRSAIAGLSSFTFLEMILPEPETIKLFYVHQDRPVLSFPVRQHSASIPMTDLLHS